MKSSGENGAFVDICEADEFWDIFGCLGVKIVVLEGDEGVENNFVGFDQQTGGAGQKDKPVKEKVPKKAD